MKKNYRIEKIFSPAVSFGGIFMFVLGLIISFFDIKGLTLVIFGGFMGLSSSGSTIDYANRKIRKVDFLFGFISIGKWVQIDDTMQIGIKKNKKSWKVHSRSNRTMDYSIKDIRIILCDKNRKEILPIMKVKNYDKAKEKIETLKTSLKIKEVSLTN